MLREDLGPILPDVPEVGRICAGAKAVCYPKPYTLNPKPLNPKPYTLNPKPCTLSAKA